MTENPVDYGLTSWSFVSLFVQSWVPTDISAGGVKQNGHDYIL